MSRSREAETSKRYNIKKGRGTKGGFLLEVFQAIWPYGSYDSYELQDTVETIKNSIAIQNHVLLCKRRFLITRLKIHFHDAGPFFRLARRKEENMLTLSSAITEFYLNLLA